MYSRQQPPGTPCEPAWIWLPDVTASQYFHLNAISAFMLAFNTLLLFPQLLYRPSATRQYAGSLIALAGLILLQLWYRVATHRRWKRAGLLSPELEKTLVDRLRLSVLRIDFRVNSPKVGDLVAWQFRRRRVCFIPERLVATLSHEVQDPEESEALIALPAVAHEVGHLVTGDSRHLQRSLLLAGSAVIAGLGTAIAIFPRTPFAALRLVVGFAAIVSFVGWLSFRMLRAREVEADRGGGVFLGMGTMRTFLVRLADRERFLKPSRFYQLTHPTFAARLQRFDAPLREYEYTYAKCVIAGILLGLTIGAFPLGSHAMLDRFGAISWALIVPLGIYLPMKALSAVVFPATLTGQLTASLVFKRACQMWLWSAVALIIAMFLFSGIHPLATATGNRSRDAAINSLWLNQGYLLYNFMVLHMVYYVGMRRVLHYRGPKRADSRFYAVGAVWLGLVAALAGTLGLFVLSAILMPLLGTILITLNEAKIPSDFVLQSRVVAGVTAFILIAVATLAWRWNAYVWRKSRQWGGNGEGRAPAFVEEEWAVGPGVLASGSESPNRPAVESVAPPQKVPLSRGCSLAIGLILYPPLGAVFGAYLALLTGKDVVTQGLAGFTGGIICAFIIARSRR